MSCDDRMLWRKVKWGNSAERDLDTLLDRKEVKKGLFPVVGTFEPRLESSAGERYLSIYRRRNSCKKKKSKCVVVLNMSTNSLTSALREAKLYFPFPWVWADLVTYLLQSMREKWWRVLSETRSETVLQLPPWLFSSVTRSGERQLPCWKDTQVARR